MRIVARVLWLLALASTIGSSVFANSPFDIILGDAPDIAVTDIHQESNYVYMRVCNLGGSITDSDTTLALAMKKSGGGVVALVEPVALGTNDCHEFRAASVDELGITTSGTYDISAGAILKNGRIERTTNNNKITRSVNIAYPAVYTPSSQGSNYYYQGNNTNSYYCNSSNNYCSSNNYLNNNTYYCSSSNSYSSTAYCPGNNYGSTTYYCIPGTSNCSTTPYSNYNYNYNNTSYCNYSNNYCNNTNYNGSTIYYRANICPPGDFACNNTYYNSTNTPYQNGNTYCTYSNNYCNNSYNNTYNGNYNYNYNYIYNQPDLVVQRVYQNSSDKHIIAQICNQGGDMDGSVSIRTNFASNNTTANMYNSLQMGRGQCTSTVVYTTPAELGITYNGNYSINVTVDANNNINESNESNNTFTQYLFVETDRNQKSDLVVDRISANDNNRTIVAHVCNVGDDMLDYNNWVMEISNTTNNTTMRNSGYRLQRDQCTDVATSYASLGVYRSGGYNFRVVIDPDNAISEQSRFNNSLTQYLQIWMNY
ncbi:MAG: CARDB domain-containing protein [Candidatus Gracilibacteria bacterium]|nr:CARDB domain-containing protein [Candidatus Gracilibacteria bacterium]